MVNDYSKLNAESAESRLAVIHSNETEVAQTEQAPFEPRQATPEELQEILREIHAEIDAEQAMIAKSEMRILDNMLRNY